ncbi:MAG: DUF4012 domain-containing protein [Acidimicrobiia bacterium]
MTGPTGGTTSSRRRRIVRSLRRHPVLLGTGLVVVVWAVACGVLLARAAADLRDGRAAAREARDHLDAEAVAAGTPVAPLRRAANHLDRAAAATGNPLLAPARFLPVVGRQLRSVHALSEAVAEVADAAAEGVATLQGVLDGRDLAGGARITQLRVLDDAVARVAARVGAVDDLGPSKGLVGPLVDARNEVAAELAEAKESLADAAAGTSAARRLLEGPRRYLLVAANNAEMRAGSGMWLSAGLLTTEGGELSLGDVEPIYEFEVPAGAVTATGVLSDRWGWLAPETEWRNLMVSPRFAESAELASRMWAAAGGGEVDGVLAIDPVALRALIASTGPIQLDDGTVTADDVLPDLLHDQYEGIQTGDDAETGQRRDRLSRLTGATFDALEAGSWSPATLARELGAAVRGRHLLAWSSHPDEQAGWEAAGMDGALTSDSLAVSLLNTGGNKLDWFVRTDVVMTSEPGEGGRTAVRLAVRIDNPTPEGESGYVAGPHPALVPLLRAGDYRGMLAVNLPGQADDIEVEGVDAVEVRGADGPTRVVGSTVVVRRGSTVEVTVRFTLPASVGSVLIEPSARVPAARWHYGGGAWQDDRRRVANV